MYYSVKAGKKPGIFDSWNACEASIIDHPNPVYQKFENYRAARTYLDDDYPMNAYIGGYCDEKRKIFKYVVILEKNKNYRGWVEFLDEPLNENTMEMLAILQVLIYCKNKNISGIHIHMTLPIIRSLALNKQNGKNQLEKSFQRTYKQLRYHVAVTLSCETNQKLLGHSMVKSLLKKEDLRANIKCVNFLKVAIMQCVSKKVRPPVPMSVIQLKSDYTHFLTDDFTNQVPVYYTFLNQKVTVQSWPDFYILVLKDLAKYDTKKFMDIIRRPEMNGHKYLHFSKVPTDLKTPAKIGEINVFAEKRISPVSQRYKLRYFLEHMNLSIESIQIKTIGR